MASTYRGGGGFVCLCMGEKLGGGFSVTSHQLRDCQHLYVSRFVLFESSPATVTSVENRRR